MKYGNKKTVVDGHVFDSQAEADYYLHLLGLKDAGKVTEIELQPKFLLQPSFKKDGRTIRAMHYTADFRVTYADGTVEVVEVKGFETEPWKIRKKLFEYRYRDLNLVVWNKAKDSRGKKKRSRI